MFHENESDAVSAVIRAAFALISMGVNAEATSGTKGNEEATSSVFLPTANMAYQTTS